MLNWFYGVILFIFGALVGYAARSGGHETVHVVASVPMDDSAVPAETPSAFVRQECWCGAEQTCPFGEGIVGSQRCRTDIWGFNHWSRCEPLNKDNDHAD